MATPRRRTHFIIPLLATFIDAMKRTVINVIGGAGTLNDPGHTHNVSTQRTVVLGALATAGGAYVGQYAAGAPIDDSVGPFAQFFPPRTVQVVAGVGAAAHTVTITGTDCNGNALTDTINVTAAGTFQGARAFSTVTRVQTNIDPGGTINIQAGTGFGIGPGVATLNLLSVNEAVEAPASSHAATGTVIPTTVPNGTRRYAVQYTYTVPSASNTTGVTSDAAGAAPVHTDRDERTVAVANASSLDTSLALCKALLTVYAAHAPDALHHHTGDETNAVASVPADVIDLPSAITAANELKAAFNAHRVENNTHWTDDTTNVVSSPDATDQTSVNTLLNELKTDLNAHLGAGFDEPPSWRIID